MYLAVFYIDKMVHSYATQPLCAYYAESICIFRWNYTCSFYTISKARNVKMPAI